MYYYVYVDRFVDEGDVGYVLIKYYKEVGQRTKIDHNKAYH